MSWIVFIGTTMLVAQVAPVVAAEVVATRLDGQSLGGQLQAWSDGTLTLQSDGKRVVIVEPELISIRSHASMRGEPAVEFVVELVDGTRLPVNHYTVVDGEAILELAPFWTPRHQTLRVPVELVRAVQFGQFSTEDALVWDEISAFHLPGDVLVIRRRAEAKLDHLQGVLGEVTTDQVMFSLDDETIPVSRSKVAGFQYYRPRPTDASEGACTIHAVGGLQIVAKHLRYEQEFLKFVTAGGSPLAIPWEKISWIDFSSGKLVYLSDLAPQQSRWTPLIGLPASVKLAQAHGQPQFDRSFFGTTLSVVMPQSTDRAEGQVEQAYGKGVAMRSRSELAYRVPEGCKRFVALAGIDPHVLYQGQVQLMITGDGQVLLDREVRGTDAPLEIDVPVENVRVFRLLVDYGGNLDSGDLVNLCDAKFTK
ncbi:MAG: NPCBM/NEW2 domain-containing protein [Pirellulales bacterium]|jgi:hypothetical protein|nr:NPCBM/NEW2 domain-containing protein [Pirellulales bacterium]